jgi:hypothetical protein
MKWFIASFMISCTGVLVAAQVQKAPKARKVQTVPKESVVSKGALTEGLFILHNKEREVKEAIQDLKKELTHCFSLSQPALHGKSEPGKPESEKTDADLQTSLEGYHCKLKQLIYPTYIDELGILASHLTTDIDQILKEEPIKKTEFDAIMKRAFLLHQKLTLEKNLLRQLYVLDNQKKSLADKQLLLSQGPRNKILGKEIVDLMNSSESEESSLSALKARLSDINKAFYTNGLVQEVFLERLLPYSVEVARPSYESGFGVK